jgi:hypothetical protein
MANPTGGLFQTLVAAASEAAANLKFQNALVDSIFWDFKPVVATPNTTLNVIIPTVDESDVTDIGSGAINVTDTDHNSVAVPFDKHFSTSFVIKAWDQARTPQDLEKTYIRPRFEALLRKVNGTIAQLINTSNFGTSATPVPGYGKKSGSTTGYFLRSDINLTRSPMALNGTPMDDGNLSFVTGPTAFGKMISDQSLIYQYIVGQDAALAAQQRAKLAAIFGAEVKWDQHFEQFASVNGFTNQPGALIHKYAIAGVTAQPAPTDNPAIQEQIVWLKGVLPVQVQMGASLEQQGTIVHIHCFWGSKVARPDFACLIDSA